MKLSLLVCMLMSACAVGNPGSDDGGVAPQEKHCNTPNAMYQVVFTKLSGDCPNIDDKVSYQWIDENYRPILPPYCTDHGEYDACTTYVNEDCKNYVYDQQLYGPLNWSPSGTTASGVLTFVVFELKTGDLFCSSEYQTDYVMQWNSPLDDGGTE